MNNLYRLKGSTKDFLLVTYLPCSLTAGISVTLPFFLSTCLSVLSVSLSPSTCTCWYDEIKETPDLKIYSPAHSQIHSLLFLYLSLSHLLSPFRMMTS